MKKSQYTTLGMLAAFALLLAWYFLYEKKYRPELTKKEEETKQFVSLEKDKVQEIVLERMKNPPSEETQARPSAMPPVYEKIRLKRVEDAWSLVEPVSDQADSGAISSLLSTLIGTKHDRIVDENPKDLSIFGLTEPVIKISISGDSKTQELLIGRKTPVGYGVYVKKTGDGSVYKATQSLRSGLEKTVKDLRNKTIVNWVRSDIAEVEISGQTNLILKHGDKDTWFLARENVPADTNETNKLLNTLTDLRVAEFASEDGKLSDFGLKIPMLRIVLVNAKDKSRLVLSVGQAKEKTYVRREDKPNIYEVATDTWSKLTVSSDKYRNLEVASFNRFDVKRIKIERNQESLEFLKENSDWAFPLEPSFKVDNNQIDTFLTKLQDMRLVRYGRTTSIPKKPELVIRLFEKKENQETEKVVLQFSGLLSKEVMVERTGLPIGFFVKVDDVKALKTQKSDFEKTIKPTESAKPEKSAG